MNWKLPALLLAAVAAALGYYLATRDRQPPPPPPLPGYWTDPGFRAALGKAAKAGTGGIAVVAPASGVGEELEKTLRDIATQTGVRFSPDALNRNAVPYNANSDEARLRLFREALEDPGVEVLWMLRGGYGSARLLPEIAKLTPGASRKVLVGYSDITCLHALFQKWGRRTVHGAMFRELETATAEKGGENFQRLTALLAGDMKELSYSDIRPFNKAAESASAVAGELTGGNLTCLVSLAGTPWFPDTAGRILFIEDVSEPGYKIDRMLTQLRQASGLDGVEAVLLGEFSKGDDKTEFALERFAKELDKPVFRSDCFGHGEKNYPLVFNSPAVIEKTAGDGAAFTLRIDAALE